MTAQAQTYGDEGPTLTPNTMGLVYEDAINENLPGKANIQRVNYKIDGIEVVANVYTPAGYDAQGSYAAIIYTIPFVLTTTELLHRIRNYRFKN